MSRLRAAGTAVAAALLAVGAPATAAAPALAASQSQTFSVPPYTVIVTLPDPVPVADDAVFGVTVRPADPLRLGAIAVPRTGTDSTPGRTRVDAGPPGRFTVHVAFPVRGGWTLALFLSSATGRWEVVVPVTVASPGAIPVPVGWSIGLAPLLGLAAFLATQVRLAGRLERGRAAARTG